MKPRGVFDLRNIVGEEKRSVGREVFSDYMNSLHKEVKLKLEQSNHKYKENVYRRRRHHDFKVGDEVMVHLKKGRSPIGTYSKLQMRNFGPCKILRKFDSGNAYEVELLDDMDISPIFNVADLHEYYEFEDDDEVFVTNDYPKKQTEEVEHILGQRIRKKTRGKEYFEYLVKWKNRPIEDYTWISQAKLDSTWVVTTA